MVFPGIFYCLRRVLRGPLALREWEIGLTDDAMMKWHRLFETRHPEGHANFLAWLGIPPDEIAGIRAKSR